MNFNSKNITVGITVSGIAAAVIGLIALSQCNFLASKPHLNVINGDNEMKSYVANIAVNCNEYNAQPNDIKKSIIFNKVHKSIPDKFTNIHGKIQRLMTNHGGGELVITIRVMGRTTGYADWLSPGTDFEEYSISNRSEMYAAVSNMHEGQCVKFSVESLREMSSMESGTVCDPDYYVHFTSIVDGSNNCE